MQVSHQKVYKQGKNLYCKMWWTKRTRAVGITASNKKAPPHSRHELPNHRLTWKRQLAPRLSNVPAEHQAAGTRTHRAARRRSRHVRREPGDGQRVWLPCSGSSTYVLKQGGPWRAEARERSSATAAERDTASRARSPWGPGE